MPFPFSGASGIVFSLWLYICVIPGLTPGTADLTTRLKSRVCRHVQNAQRLFVRIMLVLSAERIEAVRFELKL